MEKECIFCRSNIDRIEHFLGGTNDYPECAVTKIFKSRIAAITNSSFLNNASFKDFALYTSITEPRNVMIILLFSLTIWHLRNWIIFKRKDPKESSRNFACLNLFKSNVNLYAKRFYFKWFQTTPLSTGAIYKKKEYIIKPFTNVKIEIKR